MHPYVVQNKPTEGKHDIIKKNKNNVILKIAYCINLSVELKIPFCSSKQKFCFKYYFVAL